MKDCFALVQLTFDAKVVNVVPDRAVAEKEADKLKNLGYGVLVIPVAYAALLKDQNFPQPNYK
jgi:hypothetical protein